MESRTVLELGAGSGLPGLICAHLGAKLTVITDYPDADLIENLRYNIAHCGSVVEDTSNVHAEVGSLPKCLVASLISMEQHRWTNYPQRASSGDSLRQS